MPEDILDLNNDESEGEIINQGEAVTQLDGGRLIKLPLVGEIKESFLNYAMSVIVDRALPDIRDGLSLCSGVCYLRCRSLA